MDVLILHSILLIFAISALPQTNGQEEPSQEENFVDINSNEGIASKMHEADMKLTTDQAMYFLGSKKGVANPFFLWPEAQDGFPHVRVRFTSGVDVQAIRNGIMHWEEHTCIKFDETTSTSGPQLIFEKLSGCWSYVGYLGGTSTYANGQTVSIGRGCTSLVVVVHEVGHALGLFHEQSRPDRDDFLRIQIQNIESEYISNFRKHDASMIDNRGVLYDYTSDMHYGSSHFTKNGFPTLLTTDPLDQELLNKRTGLSHRDKLMANKMYSCLEKWLQMCGMPSDPCQNEGYIGMECICVCPSGTSGELCETREQDYYAALRNPCNEVVSQAGEISLSVTGGVTCAKRIVAPEGCTNPMVTFKTANINCNTQGVEIRTNDLFAGTWFGCNDGLQGMSFTSPTTNEIVILSYAVYSSDWSADVSFESCSNVTTETPTTSTTTSTTPSPTPSPPPTSSINLDPNGDCSARVVNGAVEWLTPNYEDGNNYEADSKCTIKASTDSPHAAVFKFNFFKLEPKTKGRRKTCPDAMSYSFLNNRNKMKKCGTLSGKAAYAPNFNFTAVFKSNDKNEFKGFNITIVPVSSECHKMVTLDSDNPSMNITSPLNMTIHPRKVLCEWWIMAPEGERITMNYIDARKTGKCRGRLAVDLTGQKGYARGRTTKIFLNNWSSVNRPSNSVANILKLAFVGKNPERCSFTANFSIKE